MLAGVRFAVDDVRFFGLLRCVVDLDDELVLRREVDALDELDFFFEAPFFGASCSIGFDLSAMGILVGLLVCGVSVGHRIC